MRLRTVNEALERARANTEAERATLAAVVASIGDGLLVLDPAASIRICNQHAADLLASDREHVLGQDADGLRELLAAAADDAEQVRALFEQTLANPCGRQSLELRTAGPPRRDLLVELFPLHTPTGKGTGVVLRDLTADRELDRAKDELVALVSHELRTPLTGILGFAELLLAHEHEPEQRTHHLTTILQEARRLGALIDDFLDLQRLDRGADRVEPAPTDLRPLLQRAAQAHPEQQHPVLLDLPTQLPAVLADSERIWQVLVNLLANARKYSPQGGEIRRISARSTSSSRSPSTTKASASPRSATPPLRRLLPRRRPRPAGNRRHRPRPLDQPQDHPRPRRPHLGRIRRARTRLPLHLHAPARGELKSPLTGRTLRALKAIEVPTDTCFTPQAIPAPHPPPIATPEWGMPGSVTLEDNGCGAPVTEGEQALESGNAL